MRLLQEFGYSRVSGQQRARLAAEQLANMATNSLPAAVSGMIGAGTTGAGVLWIEGASAVQVGVWLLALAAPYAVHVCLGVLWRRRRPTVAAAPGWCRRFAAVGLAEGCLWCCGILWFCASGSLEQELLVVLIAGGVAGAVGLSFGSYMPAYLARFLPVTLPYIIWAACFARGHAAMHELLALVVFFFVLGNLQLARGFGAGFVSAQLTRFENIDLAAELRVQKEAAEAATLAKSRFLAAASHDLRQPVHALSLFVGALHGADLPPDALRLLDHIDNAVVSVDGLFASLLDISRLDAGAVPVRTQSFPLFPLLERIVRDHALETLNKGIRLRLLPCSAWVSTDPVLLERIMRNLIGNAVRYTDSGRVLVGCRRRGAAISLQVWDTGRGIPADEQDRIFDEFHQILAPGAERGPGLGLGLAIVRRLAELLGLRLSLQSVPGRGSCFSLAVQRVDAPAALPARPEDARAPFKAAGLVLVIDDNAGIRDAMAALLRHWGHRALVAGSLQEARGVTSEVPNLIICDYHLGASGNGIEAIAALRQAFGRSVPAMLITGDTALPIGQAAQAAGLLLLQKPVPNGRLRAAVGRLLDPAGAEMPAIAGALE
jgi:signal transduction histidine kinase/CheY-like chemotaxis protein